MLSIQIGEQPHRFGTLAVSQSVPTALSSTDSNKIWRELVVVR